jgi:hypothetical protein
MVKRSIAFRKIQRNKSVKNNRSATPETIEEGKLHFYDYEKTHFRGITFSKNEKEISKIMCTEKIVCHKMPFQRTKKLTPEQQKKHLQRYLATISNPAMREYIKFRFHQLTFKIEKNENPWVIFSLDDGISDQQIKDLTNPELKNIKVALNMEGLMSYGYYLYEMMLPGFVKKLSDLTKSTIKDCDLGELIFGGKKKLANLREMFHNLKRTIGMKNIFIIANNYEWYQVKHICNLFSCMFDMNFCENNFRISTDKNKVYDIVTKLAYS